MAKKKKRLPPGPPRKPDAEKSSGISVSIAPDTRRRLLRVFGNASAGGRRVLNSLSEEDMIRVRDGGKT